MLMIQKPSHFETMEASTPETGKRSDEPQERFDSLHQIDLDWKWMDGYPVLEGGSNMEKKVIIFGKAG